jgi:ankyrin repeat protein
VAKQVLDRGAEVASSKHKGQTALVFAAADGHEAVAKQWLDHGVDMAAASHNVVTA